MSLTSPRSGCYIRCTHIDSNGMQCEDWFEMNAATKASLCSAHLNNTAPSLSISKPRFIDLQNNELALCHKMTFDELELHVANLDKQLEELKQRTSVAKSVRRVRADDLSEDERKKRTKALVASHIEKEVKYPDRAIFSQYGMSDELAKLAEKMYKGFKGAMTHEQVKDLIFHQKKPS